MYILDTNIFIRAAVKEKNDRVLTDCLLLLESLERGETKATLPGFVLAELVWVLNKHYRFTKEKIIYLLDRILVLRGLSTTDDYTHALAIDLFAQHNVKYIDCCLASLPGVLEGKHTIVSYDTEFDKLGVQRVEPTVVLEKLWTVYPKWANPKSNLL